MIIAYYTTYIQYLHENIQNVILHLCNETLDYTYRYVYEYILFYLYVTMLPDFGMMKKKVKVLFI